MAADFLQCLIGQYIALWRLAVRQTFVGFDWKSFVDNDDAHDFFPSSALISYLSLTREEQVSKRNYKFSKSYIL